MNANGPAMQNLHLHFHCKCGMRIKEAKEPVVIMGELPWWHQSGRTPSTGGRTERRGGNRSLMKHTVQSLGCFTVCCTIIGVFLKGHFVKQKYVPEGGLVLMKIV